MKTCMRTYNIDEIDLFTFIKDMECSQMLAILGHQWHAILLAGYQWYDSDDTSAPCCSSLAEMIIQPTSIDMLSYSKMSKIFLYMFIQKYIVKNNKYKGWGLGIIEQGISNFFY